MQLSLQLGGAALILSMAAPVAAQTALPVQPPRWVMADDLRVRSGPSQEHKVIGTLPRGAELILKTAAEIDGFCHIEGEGQYGYVACNYLSAERVARPRAGEDGVDAAQRWVTGNSVTVRDAPRPDGAIVSRLGLNAIVKQLREEPGTGYCEVQPTSGASGFTACRFLAPTPVILAHIQGYRRADEAPSPDYNPERAFWLEPTWGALVQYAEHLKARHPNIPMQGPWPRDDALERMKAHLALGTKGRKPKPFADWMELKRKASQDLDLNAQARPSPSQAKTSAEESRRRFARMTQVSSELRQAIGIWGPLHDENTADGGAARTIRLIRALELPSIQPSLFRTEAELAPPNATAEEASGRFGIVFRQLVTPRPKPKSGAEEGNGPGLYDMLARTDVLVRPVQRVQLFRDGRLHAESSLLRKKETLWRDVDEPMCSGWIPGFSFGQADTSIWRYFNGDPGIKVQSIEEAKLNNNPPGSLYAFYTNIDLPRGPAMRTETPMKMDRTATGFVQGTHLHYDLDADGIADLSVWEGQGRGPGHLDGATTTDDRWYRLVLANVNGAWKVLGSDEFSYGCGC